MSRICMCTCICAYMCVHVCVCNLAAQQNLYINILHSHTVNIYGYTYILSSLINKVS